MKVSSKALALLIFIASHGLTDASGLRSERKLQERSGNKDFSNQPKSNPKDRKTETFGGVTVTTNADDTEPSSNIYLFEVNKGNGSGNSACASLRRYGVEKEDCTYLEHVNIGYFKSDKETVVDALSKGDFRLYVESIESNQEVQALGTLENSIWGLDYTDGTYRDDRYEYDDVTDASKVVVVIIDTGIKFDHEEFDSVQSYTSVSFVEGDTDAYDDPQGHGTHCAGTAVGKTVGVGMGLANVQLSSVTVLSAQGSGSTAGVIRGVDWVTGEARANSGLKYVASMSLGGGFSSSLNNAVNILASEPNAEVVVAAGNDGRNGACGYSPASATSAITVGSITSSETRSSFSNYGDCVDMFAPGSGIYSASISGTNSYVTYSGTSMATPHVTGAVAIALAKDMNVEDLYKQNCPNVTPNVCLTSCLTIPGADCSGGSGGGGGGDEGGSGGGGGTCRQVGQGCSNDNECCSRKCKGRWDRKTCK